MDGRKATVTNQGINFDIYEKVIDPIKNSEEEYFQNYEHRDWGRCYSYLIPIRIYNKDTQKLLNYIINYKYVLSCHNESQGGIFFEPSTRFCKNYVGDFFIYFKKSYPYSKAGKSVNTPSVSEAIKFIEGRLAAAIKEFLNHNNNKIIGFKDIDNPTTVLKFDRYYVELLHSFFKKENLSKKFTKDQIKNVIGEKLDNQLLISALDVYKNEISKLEKEQKYTEEKISEKYREKVFVLNQELNEKKAQNKRFYQKKIDEIQAQINEMLKNN